jgi:hypothetical protein
MSFDWTAATLLRKFAPLDAREITGNLACPVCSFKFNDYRFVESAGITTTIPRVRREVIGKNGSDYSLVCGHFISGLIRFWDDEFVSDADLGESIESLVRGSE